MIFSPSKRVLSEIEGNERLSEVAKGYIAQRARNSFYDYVLTKFREAEAEHNLTKAELAERLGLGRDRVSKLLGSPGNWTIDTIAELLAGICREELVPSSQSFLRRAPRNHSASDLVGMDQSPATGTSGVTFPRQQSVVKFLEPTHG